MQQLPLLKGYDIDIVKPITSYLSKRYGKKKIAAAVATVETIQKQRKTVLNITKYRSADDITQHKCYYDYLRQLQLALPFADKNGIQVSFTWYSSFGGKKMVSTDIRFEQACVLYNIAALYTQAAYDSYSKNDESPETYTTCINFLRYAVSFFDELTSKYSTAMQSLKIGYDFDPKVLQIYKYLAMAQGQHIYYAKGRIMKVANLGLSALTNSCSDLYKQLFDLCEANKYIPKDLGKHFYLEYLFMRILAIHFFGMYCLEREEKEKENSGLLYGLANELDKLITETKKFMQTFHLEVCDQQQGEQVIKLVSDDKQQFYRVYRIYGGIVPEKMAIPDGRVMMKPAESLELTEIPLSFDLPENADVTTAILQYNQKRDELVRAAHEIHVNELQKVYDLLNKLLIPDIISGEGFKSGLPPSIEKHWKAIKEKGLLKNLRCLLDKDLEEYLNCKTMNEDADRQVERAGPIYEQLRWIEKTLSMNKTDLDMLDKKYTTLCQYPNVFTENIGKFMDSIPACEEYCPYNATVEIKNSTDHVLTQIDKYKALINALDTDHTGEAIVRNRVQADGNLLNIETILFEATQSINGTIAHLNTCKDSLTAYVKQLANDYKAWMKKRSVSSAMKKREENLQKVAHALSMYDSVESDALFIADTLEDIKNRLTTIKESYCM